MAISLLVPPHLFKMNKQLDALRNGGCGYKQAVDGIAPRGSLEKCGKEFYKQMPILSDLEIGQP